MEDIYTQLYNALDRIGKPNYFAGYAIKYHQAEPLPKNKQFAMLPKEEQLAVLTEIEDTNQAEIVVDNDYPICDKLQQMWYLLSLLPKVVQRGLFDV